MKIYCKNCKYYHPRHKPDNYDYSITPNKFHCNAMGWWRVEFNFNYNKDCSKYVRKWWKFWVKENE